MGVKLEWGEVKGRGGECGGDLLADGGESGVSAIGEREIVRPHCFLGSQSPRDQPQKPSRACGRAAAAAAHGVISTPTAASCHIARLR